MADLQQRLAQDTTAQVRSAPDDTIKGKVMRQPETFEFEGAQRTVAQNMAMLRERRIGVSECTVRARLRKGQRTAREIAKPIATVNRAWNAREMRP